MSATNLERDDDDQSQDKPIVYPPPSAPTYPEPATPVFPPPDDSEHTVFPPPDDKDDMWYDCDSVFPPPPDED